jgi:hypothetical protein
MCQRKTFCEKHNIERRFKFKKHKNCREYYCNLCQNEKDRQKTYLKNINNPNWVAKQNYISNLTDEEKETIRLEKAKEYAKKYNNSEKRKEYIRNYQISILKIKECKLYCNECSINRVYGKSICIECKNHKDFVLRNNYTSTCLHCKNTFGLETKLLNKGIFDKINTFCSLKCSKDNIKYNLEIRKENFKNDNKKINKKREWDRFYSAAKRIENPNRVKETIEKYKQSDKYKERVNYYKVKSKEGQCSNIYCIECNDVRLYGDKLCDKCKLIKKYTDAYNFTSVCKHCNQEYGIDKKLNNLGVVHHINNYCSIECNEELKKITKKRNSLLKRKSRNKYNRIRDDKQWAKLYGNKYEPISRTIVYRKHKYICTSCGVKCIHPNKDNYNQSNAATLDHIIPKSKGGSHTYDNVTLLCRSCNTMKSDKILTNYKRNISQMEIEFTGYIAQGSQLQLQLQ